MKKVKSNISFMPVVESINRKFALRRETCSEKLVGEKVIEPIKYMGAGTRTKSVAGYGSVNVNYFFMRKFARASAVTADERTARLLFGVISKAVAALMKDLNQLSLIQNMWRQAIADFSKTINGISAYGRDFRGWVWAVQYAGKKDDASYNVNVFPSTFDA